MKKTIIKLIVALLVVYFAGVGIFTIITLPNTYVGSVEKSYVRLSDALDRDADSRKMLISGRNNKKLELRASDFGYSESVKSGETIPQNQFTWPISWFVKHEYTPEYNYTYSEQQLEDYISSSALMADSSAPVNAKVDILNGKYQVVPSKPGDSLNKADAIKSILDAFLKGKEELILESEYMKPEITEDDPILQTKADELNKIIQMKISVNFGDDIEVLEGEKLLDFYKFTGSTYEPIKEQLYEYLRKLAIKYDTFSPETERKFNATAKGIITVKGGIYGWQMDVDETTKLMVDALKKRESIELTPIFLNEGLKRGLDDIGNTYIEVDLSRQHLWYYKNGELLTDTDIVSGDPTRGVATPIGVGKVWSKEKDRSLVGIVPEGSADYSSYVDFWMPINWSGVGIHNSRWRNAFGGNIYNGSGSFGCINLPYDPTKIIYENVELNTPVIVYN